MHKTGMEWGGARVHIDYLLELVSKIHVVINKVKTDFCEKESAPV